MQRLLNEAQREQAAAVRLATLEHDKHHRAAALQHESMLQITAQRAEHEVSALLSEESTLKVLPSSPMPRGCADLRAQFSLARVLVLRTPCHHAGSV